MTGLRTAALIVAATDLLILAIGVYFFAQRSRIVQEGKPVRATVLRAAAEVRGDSDGASTEAAYELAYVVDGVNFRGKATSSALLDSAEGVQERVAKHPAGTDGIVHVNPANASEIRLNLGKNAATFLLPWLVLATGGFLLMMAVSLWMMGAPGDVW